MDYAPLWRSVMSKEIDDLFNDVELDDISDLGDIDIDEVGKILSKYNLDDISADATHADKIINEAYAMVNEKDYTIDGDDLSKEELEKLHEEIFAEVESTVKDAKEKEKENKKNSKINKDKKNRKKKSTKDDSDNKQERENNKQQSEDETLQDTVDDIVEEKDDDEQLVNDEELDNEDEELEKEKFTDKICNGFKKLFYNVQDPEYEKKQRKLDRKEKRKNEAKAKEKEKAKEDKAIKDEEKKKKAAEVAAAKKKEKDEQNRKKAEQKKKKDEEKKAKKEARKKEEDNEPVGRINKLGALVVFLFVGLILLAIIGYSMKGLKIDYKKQAQTYLSRGEYEQAYLTLLKDKSIKEDSELFRQVKILQKLNQQISYYDSNIALFEREKALDALIKGVEIYDTDLVSAKRLSVEKEYNLIYEDIKKYLKEEFGINEKTARELIEINNSEDYSERINEIIKKSKKKNK